MRSFQFFAASALLIALSADQAAAAWQSNTTDHGADAWVSNGGPELLISCQPNEPRLFFTSYGGPFPGMDDVDDENDSTMMWIEAADGRTARHPIDRHCFAPDRAFLSRFVTTDLVLEQFAPGNVLSLTAPNGDSIFETSMTGTSSARQVSQRGCSL
ncbi:MAG: hypothetical protein AAFX81_03730 [Pseudomonadota bacterium]